MSVDVKRLLRRRKEKLLGRYFSGRYSFSLLIVFILLLLTGCSFSFSVSNHPDYKDLNGTFPLLSWNNCTTNNDCYKIIDIDNEGGNAATYNVDLDLLPDGNYLLFGRQLGGNVSVNGSDIRLPSSLSFLGADSQGAILVGINSSIKQVLAFHVVGGSVFQVGGYLYPQSDNLSMDNSSNQSGTSPTTESSCSGDCTAMRRVGDPWNVPINRTYDTTSVVFGSVRQTNLTNTTASVGNSSDVSVSTDDVQVLPESEIVMLDENNSVVRDDEIVTSPVVEQGGGLPWLWIFIGVFIILGVVGVIMYNYYKGMGE